MIKIEITDIESTDKEVLGKIAKCLLGIAGYAAIISPLNPPNAVGGGEVVRPKEITEVLKKNDEIENEVAEEIVPDISITATPNTEEKALFSSIDLADPAPSHDSDGFPWDERIHAGSKSVTAKGQWRYRRNVDPALIKKVEAEIRPSVNLKEYHNTDTRMLAPIPPVNVTNTGSLLPPVPPLLDLSPNRFPEFMNKVAAAVNSKKLTQAQVLEILGEFGIASIPLAGTKQDQLPMVIKRIDDIVQGIA